MNCAPQNSNMYIEIQFCLTTVNFVSQNWIMNKKSILWNRIQFCVTKFDSVSQSLILFYNIKFCSQKSIL